MTKLTRKGLVELAKELGAIKDGNIYTIGNTIHAIYRFEDAGNKEINEMINNESQRGATSVCVKQIAYSCGVYGCSGQLYVVEYNNGGKYFLYC